MCRETPPHVRGFFFKVPAWVFLSVFPSATLVVGKTVNVPMSASLS